MAKKQKKEKKQKNDRPRKRGLKQLMFVIKYGILHKKIDIEEYKVAEEYLTMQIDIYTMEKDLLLRGLSYKEAHRIIDAYEYLRFLTNLEPVEIITEEKLKGGILDGIRGSK